MIKNSEVFKADLDNLWVVLKLFEFDNWVEIKDTLKLFFDSNVIISPLFAENALVDMDRGPLNELLENPGKWQKFGAFHLKFEKWNRCSHSRPIYSKGYGGWISIRNLALDYWSRQTFEAIGAHCGGLENIAAETINFLNVS